MDVTSQDLTGTGVRLQTILKLIGIMQQGHPRISWVHNLPFLCVSWWHCTAYMYNNTDSTFLDESKPWIDINFGCLVPGLKATLLVAAPRTRQNESGLKPNAQG